MVFQRSFRLIYSADLSPARTFPQQARQFGELVLRSRRINFDAVVIQVSNVSPNANGTRGMLDEIAEADPLDSPANPIELCCLLSAQRVLISG